MPTSRVRGYEALVDRQRFLIILQRPLGVSQTVGDRPASQPVAERIVAVREMKRAFRISRVGRGECLKARDRTSQAVYRLSGVTGHEQYHTSALLAAREISFGGEIGGLSTGQDRSNAPCLAIALEGSIRVAQVRVIPAVLNFAHSQVSLGQVALELGIPARVPRETIQVRQRFLHDELSRRRRAGRSEEHTSELQSRENLVCRLLLEKKKDKLWEQI